MTRNTTSIMTVVSFGWCVYKNMCYKLNIIVNRRMDEWVRAACIESETTVNQDPAAIVGDHVQQEGSSERKMTRNMKRRHDEINHVQKVIA